MASTVNRKEFIKLATMGSLGLGVGGYTGPTSAPFPLDKVTKVGVIGLDTSHCIHFTKVLNNPYSPPEFAGHPVIAAYPKGSLDIESSVSRIPKYTRAMKKRGGDITGSVDELLEKVDAVLLETNDGRRHFAQALKVFKAGTRSLLINPWRPPCRMNRPSLMRFKNIMFPCFRFRPCDT